MVKPTFEHAAVAAFLTGVLGERPSSLEPLAEGLESQAFRFSTDAETFVLRISPSIRGFQKDLWAHAAVGSRVPVPRVARLGSIDERHAYCITEWIPGPTLEDLTPSAAETLVEEVRHAWLAIAETDVSAIDGFGNFDPDGHAPVATWHDVLRTTAENAGRTLIEQASPARLQSPAPVVGAFVRLIDGCPAKRGLVHGDFGSNNVLTDGRRITAVLDWDNAMVGDPLYDVANTYFWAPYLPCMQAQARHFGRTLSHLPAFRERILCYALRIGIEEACESAVDGHVGMAEWALNRCLELLADAERGA